MPALRVPGPRFKQGCSGGDTLWQEMHTQGGCVRAAAAATLQLASSHNPVCFWLTLHAHPGSSQAWAPHRHSGTCLNRLPRRRAWLPASQEKGARRTHVGPPQAPGGNRASLPPPVHCLELATWPKPKRKGPCVREDRGAGSEPEEPLDRGRSRTTSRFGADQGPQPSTPDPVEAPFSVPHTAHEPVSMSQGQNGAPFNPHTCREPPCQAPDRGAGLSEFTVKLGKLTLNERSEREDGTAWVLGGLPERMDLNGTRQADGEQVEPGSGGTELQKAGERRGRRTRCTFLGRALGASTCPEGFGRGGTWLDVQLSNDH